MCIRDRGSPPRTHEVSSEPPLLSQLPADGLLSGRYKVGIQALLLDQLRMSAALDDMSVVQYKDCLLYTSGVDVHKSFLVATIITTTGGIEPSYQKKRYSTFNNSILEFKQWLLDNDCHDLCMESTGKYWIPVFNLLEDEINVTIANPKWVKAVKGNKDDTKDSKWIGDLFRLGLVKGSYIPCKKIRILREFTRYRYKIVSCRSSEKNRYQNALTVCNVALDSVVSDICLLYTSKISLRLIKYSLSSCT